MPQGPGRSFFRGIAINSGCISLIRIRHIMEHNAASSLMKNFGEQPEDRRKNEISEELN
jgi:hypothetical protein